MSWLVVRPKTVLLSLLLSCVVFFGGGWRTAVAVVSLAGARDLVCEAEFQKGGAEALKKCLTNLKINCEEAQTNDKNGVKFCNPRYSCAQHCNNVVDNSGKIVQCCSNGPQQSVACPGGVGKMVNGKYSCDISSGPPKDSPSSAPNSGQAPPGTKVPPGCAFFNGKVQCAQMDSGSGGGAPGQQPPPGSGLGGGLPSMLKEWGNELAKAFGNGNQEQQQRDAEQAFKNSGTLMETRTFSTDSELQRLAGDASAERNAEEAFKQSGNTMMTFTSPVQQMSNPPQSGDSSLPESVWPTRNPERSVNENSSIAGGQPDLSNAIARPYSSDYGNSTLQPAQGGWGSGGEPAIVAQWAAERQQLQQMTFWQALGSGTNLIDWYSANY